MAMKSMQWFKEKMSFGTIKISSPVQPHASGVCIIHSNTEKKSVFSCVKKRLTLQCASVELDGTLYQVF